MNRKTVFLSLFIFLIAHVGFAAARPIGTYRLTGFLLIDSERTAFTINPSSNSYLRITVLNRDEVKKGIAEATYAKLVDAKINITRFTGPFSAEGKILNFKVSDEGAAPAYNHALKRMKPPRQSRETSF